MNLISLGLIFLKFKSACDQNRYNFLKSVHDKTLQYIDRKYKYISVDNINFQSIINSQNIQQNDDVGKN